jgi:methionine synthase I (cobalamin-dependent)
MKRDIRERLRHDVLLADGAMGTLLVSRGAPADGPRSPLSVSAPDLVREIHDDYVAAGAQLITTNTWDANRSKLTRFDWADSLERINREAVRLAKAAAEGEYVLVAGELGPLGQLVKPYGPLTKAQVREIFTEQARLLLGEGVDLIRLSTFSSELEALEALRAVRSLSADVPLLASITVLADGKTSFGDEAEHALNALAEAGADVVVCAHHGLDGFASIGDLWRGGLVRRTVRIRFSRFAAASIPEGREARTAWLWQRWHEVDDWIGAQGAAA